MQRKEPVCTSTLWLEWAVMPEGEAMRGETGPDFIEALARGLDVIRAFEPNRPIMTLSEVAAATGLARPTARRMLLTLEKLGYVRRAASRSHRACLSLAWPILARPTSGISHARIWNGWCDAQANPRRSPSLTAPTSSTWRVWPCRRLSRWQ